MKTFLYKTVEAGFNHYLALDPESERRMRALEGKRISLHLLGINHTYHWLIKDGQMCVDVDPTETPDVLIKGTPLSLIHMSIAKTNRKHFFKEDVSIEGNLELGQQIIDLFDEMEIDWEEYASKIVGDVSAHQLGRIMRGFGDTLNRFSESVTQNVNEYIHEEALIVPPPEALQDFFHDIDALRMDADRLEARVKRLRKLQGEAL